MPWRRGERTGNRFGGSRCRKTCWPVDHWARAKFERAQETGLVQQLKRLPTTCWSAYDRPSQNAFYQLVMPKFSQFPFSRCPSLAFPRRNTLLADFFKLLLAQLLGCAAVWQKISSNSMSCCLAVNFAESAKQVQFRPGRFWHEKLIFAALSIRPTITSWLLTCCDLLLLL